MKEGRRGKRKGRMKEELGRRRWGELNKIRDFEKTAHSCSHSDLIFLSLILEEGGRGKEDGELRGKEQRGTLKAARSA